MGVYHPTLNVKGCVPYTIVPQNDGTWKRKFQIQRTMGRLRWFVGFFFGGCKFVWEDLWLASSVAFGGVASWCLEFRP